MEALDQAKEAPGPAQGRNRLIDDVKQAVGAFPSGYDALVDVTTAIDQYYIEELTHKLDHRRYQLGVYQLGIFDTLGSREQIDSSGSLGQRAFEADGVESLPVTGNVDNRIFWLNVESRA